MTPELESRIRTLVTNGKPLLAEQGRALLDALDECARLMLEAQAKRGMTTRICLNQRAHLKEAAVTIAELRNEVAWLKGSIDTGSP